MSINDEVIAGAISLAGSYLKSYRKEIDLAYLDIDGALSVPLRIKFSPNGSQVKVETEITVSKGQYKDKNSGIFGGGLPEQMTLDEPRNRFREILFRNFDGVRKILAKIRWMSFTHKRNQTLFKKF